MSGVVTRRMAVRAIERGALPGQYQRSSDDLARIRTGLRHELARPSAVPARDADVTLSIDVELMWSLEAAGEPTPRAPYAPPVVLELTIPVVLENPVQRSREHPDPLVLV